MRFCVNGRQPYSILKKADEIKVAYIDRDRILDFVEKIPNSTIILDVPGDESDWDLWQVYNEKFDEFYIALHNLNRADEFNKANIKWYWPFPITTYYELNMIVKLHPSYLKIGPPLSFDLDGVLNQSYDKTAEPIPLRMTINVARPSYLPDNGIKGICGQWVRPEDCKLYSTRIRCFEFDEVDLKQEEILLHVYKENQNWPGNLNLIIQKLDYNVDNRAIPEELGEHRMNCRQKCQSESACRLCIAAFQFANQIKKERDNRAQILLIDNK